MLGLRTTIYIVNDLQEAKTWYSKAFGTDPYFDEAHYVGFNIGGFELGLQRGKESAKEPSVISYWGVDDIGKTYRHLLDLGATENEAPFNVGGPIMTATVKDPFGNLLGIIYNPLFQEQ